MGEPPQASPQRTIAVKFEEAKSLHQRGELALAEPLYREIIQEAPGHADALHFLGVIAYQRKQFAEGEQLIDKALAIRPDYAAALSHRGLVLAALQRPDEALASYDRALVLQPDFADALSNRGVALFGLNRLEEALEYQERALAIRPDFAGALHNRGLALSALGRTDEALMSYERALVITPDDFGALFERGNILLQLRQLEAALTSYDRALVIRPDHAEALGHRGIALGLMKRPEDALASYDRALALKSDLAEVHSNRGVALLELKRPNEALASEDQALALQPDSVAALYNRGNALLELKRMDEALTSYDRVLAINPDHVDALNNSGLALLELKRLDAALASYDRALAIEPNHVETLNNRGNALFELTRLNKAIASYEQALAIRPDYHETLSNLVFMRNFDDRAGPKDHRDARARWYESSASRFAASIAPHQNRRDPERRLRIGYVSAHFCRQAATFAFAPVVLGHDCEHFEVFCYSDTSRADDLTRRFADSIPGWREVGGLSDDELAAAIRADGIDILVDLVGHMSGNRLLVFARRPAPVQVTGWGEPTGTGLPTMDYLLADPVLVPEPMRASLQEQIIDLPCFLHYWTPDPLPEPGPLPALARRHVTFGSFNRLVKTSDNVLRCWAAILRQVRGARLVLKDAALDTPQLREHVGSVLAGEGISGERITLLGKTEHATHIRAYETIDIALDPFPHGGGMTTLEALWMGVPVITFAGETISSRLAAACMGALGLDDFIASDLVGYVSLAAQKASDPAALATLRRSIRPRMMASPIGDNTRYTRAVEAAYRAIWRRWCDAAAIA